MLFDVCDLDFELMTLVLKLDPDMVVTYTPQMRSKGQRVQKLWPGQTDS